MYICIYRERERERLSERERRRERERESRERADRAERERERAERGFWKEKTQSAISRSPGSGLCIWPGPVMRGNLGQASEEVQ